VNTDFDEATWVAERLPEVDDPDGFATDRARLALLEHMSAAPDSGRRRRRLGLRLAAVGAVPAAVGVIVLGHGPVHRTTTATMPAPRVALVPQHHRVNVHPLLLRLADDVTQAPAPPGKRDPGGPPPHLPKPAVVLGL
jgi:hypothetical protein